MIINKKDLWIAALMSFLWVALSGIYVYKGSNLIILTINIYPLILWISGLLLLRYIYDKIQIKNKILIIIPIYWILLLSMEYVGYNILKIQLDNNLPGLFGLPILHVPIWAQIYYLSAGPIFIFLTENIPGVKHE